MMFGQYPPQITKVRGQNVKKKRNEQGSSKPTFRLFSYFLLILGSFYKIAISPADIRP